MLEGTGEIPNGILRLMIEGTTGALCPNTRSWCLQLSAEVHGRGGGGYPATAGGSAEMEKLQVGIDGGEDVSNVEQAEVSL